MSSLLTACKGMLLLEEASSAVDNFAHSSILATHAGPLLEPHIETPTRGNLMVSKLTY
jgi:hypothetical protein